MFSTTLVTIQMIYNYSLRPPLLMHPSLPPARSGRPIHIRIHIKNNYKKCEKVIENCVTNKKVEKREACQVGACRRACSSQSTCSRRQVCWHPSSLWQICATAWRHIKASLVSLHHESAARDRNKHKHFYLYSPVNVGGDQNVWNFCVKTIIYATKGYANSGTTCRVM